jgi:hypothetical protein
VKLKLETWDKEQEEEDYSLPLGYQPYFDEHTVSVELVMTGDPYYI